MIDDRTSDEKLIEEWQAGSRREEISAALFARYSQMVARFFGRRGFSEDTGCDLTQEVFLRVFRGLPRFRYDSSFETWLFKIVRNVWRSAVRDAQTQKRSAAQEVPFEEDTAAPDQGRPGLNPLGGESNGRGFLDRLLVDEQLRQLRTAVAELPPKYQRLLLFRVYQGLKVSEISIMLEIPEGTVKSQLAQARKLLRRKLKHLCSDFTI